MLNILYTVEKIENSIYLRYSVKGTKYSAIQIMYCEWAIPENIRTIPRTASIF